MTSKKIAVYYIATGDYKKLFPDFLESLSNFFPNDIKIVKLISDGLEEYSNYHKDKITVELCPRINDYPWPVIALYKFWHIYQNIDFSCDYSCYFNANSIIHEMDPSLFKLDKFTVSYHSFNSKDKEYDAWKHVHINKYSSAYLENGTYEYIQSGFFFAKTNMLFNICMDINNLIHIDTCKHLFAQWHDESYLNKWCFDHKDLVDKRYIMTVYPEDVDLERFILLRDKRDYDIKK